jgi:hypothetical protein
MNLLSQITFPKNEWIDIKTRLDENKIVYTIRVDKECNKYKEGDILMTEWKSKVRILSVKKLSGGIKELEKEYQFYNQLNNEMIIEISPFMEIEIISLKAEVF